MCVYVCVYLYMCTYICMCAYVYVCMYVCICMCLSIYVYICMYVCICVCMCVYVCVCLYVLCMHVVEHFALYFTILLVTCKLYIHTYIHAHHIIHTYMHPHHIHTYIHTYIHAHHMHAYIHACMHTTCPACKLYMLHTCKHIRSQIKPYVPILFPLAESTECTDKRKFHF